MKRTKKRKSKLKVQTGLDFILPPTITTNNRARIILYTVCGLIIIFSLKSHMGNSIMTKIGITLEALSFLFLSPELFGIDDVSAIQRKVLAFTKQSARHTLSIFMTSTKRGLPEIVNRLFYWLTWPQSKFFFAGTGVEKNPAAYDWINSVEKSLPIALLNLFLLWLPGTLYIINGFRNGIPFFNSVLPLQLIMSEPLDFIFNVLSDFFIGILFSYFAVTHTLATITWHLNAIATLLRKDRERRLLAILGVWLFIFASIMQFLAA